MDTLRLTRFPDRMSTHSNATDRTDHIGHQLDPDHAVRLIARRSFCTLATVSPAGRPHVAGVLYDLVGSELFVSITRSSRKARNIEANGHAAVCIPVRRLPVGPPSTIHFQASAELWDVSDPTIRGLAAAGKLRTITSHGELDLPDGCIVRIRIPDRLLTYGLGMSLLRFVRDPLGAAGSTSLPPER